MPNPTIKQFVVEGRGEFPIDMLRSDQCWPVGVADTAAVSAHYGLPDPDPVGARTATLATAAKYSPNRQRWLSFGWRVVDNPSRLPTKG